VGTMLVSLAVEKAVMGEEVSTGNELGDGRGGLDG